MSRPAQAKERAVEIMRSDPGLHVLAPEGWMAASLRTLVETRGFASDESRLLAWYDTKVADERRIVGTMNRYFNCSGVNIDLLAEWMRALLVFMVAQRDVGVILAGTTSINVERIEKLFTQKQTKKGATRVPFFGLPESFLASRKPLLVQPLLHIVQPLN